MTTNGYRGKLFDMDFGYARVSTADQNPDHQIDALLRAEVPRDNIHLDHVSGAKASRPQFDTLMLRLRTGDTLRVTRLDRISRSVQQLINLGVDFRDRGIELHVIEQGINTATPEGRAMFGMLSVLAELQREMIVANTMDGLAAARARGRIGGRKPALKPRQVALAQQMYDELGDDGKRKHTVQVIADELGVARTTIYRYLEKK